MVDQPVRGVAFCDSCWVDPVVPNVACGPLGYLLSTVGWSCSCRDNRYDENHPPDRNHRSNGSCRFGDSYYHGDSRHPGGSRDRGGSHRRACSRPRGSSRPPNRGCHPDTFRGDVASRCPWGLVWWLLEVV